MVSAFSVVIVVLVTTAFLLRGRSLALVSGTSVVVFSLMVVLALSALFVPRPYRAAARSVLAQVGLRDRVVDLDDALPVDEVSNLVDDPESVVRDLLRERFGLDLGGDETPNAEAEVVPEKGYFERAIYDPLVTLIALVLRAGALGAGLTVMLCMLAVSYAVNAVRRAGALAATVSDLQARVTALEATERA